MPDRLTTIDLGRPASEQPVPIHNRWHPEIPPVAAVDPDQAFRLECLDATGGQIVNNDSADDVREIDLSRLICMSGPVEVRGAKPGDLLRVEILGMGMMEGHEYGYTAVLGRPGTGLLPEFDKATKAIWDLDGVSARSRHITGVAFHGNVHPGVIGCAPSAERLATWNEREGALLKEMNARPPLEIEPNADGALLGGLTEDVERVGKEAAQSWAARENGGNIDVKELTPGATILLPVYVDGAMLSAGDLHFSQGDGKVTGLGGVRMAGWLDLRCSIVDGGMKRWGIEAPVVFPGPLRANYEDRLMFTGVSVDESGKQHYLDPTVAYRQACRAAISYMRRLGYSPEQAYILLSAVPVDGKMSCLLEHPNVCVTLALPTNIFDFSLMPDAFPGEVTRGVLPGLEPEDEGEEPS